MRHRLEIGETPHDIWLARGTDADRLLLGEQWHTLSGKTDDAVVVVRGDTAFIHFNGRAHTVRYIHPVDLLSDTADAGGDSVARAPMPGSVVSLNVAAGDAVTSGDAMAVIESMKLESVIRAARHGIVETVHVSVGDSFERDAVLVTLVAEED